MSCKATTNQGLPCNNNTSKGDYCHITAHQKQGKKASGSVAGVQVAKKPQPDSPEDKTALSFVGHHLETKPKHGNKLGRGKGKGKGELAGKSRSRSKEYPAVEVATVEASRKSPSKGKSSGDKQEGIVEAKKASYDRNDLRAKDATKAAVTPHIDPHLGEDSSEDEFNKAGKASSKNTVDDKSKNKNKKNLLVEIIDRVRQRARRGTISGSSTTKPGKVEPKEEKPQQQSGIRNRWRKKPAIQKTGANEEATGRETIRTEDPTKGKLKGKGKRKADENLESTDKENKRARVTGKVESGTKVEEEQKVRFQYISDIHLERESSLKEYKTLNIPKRAEYLILAGDIGCIPYHPEEIQDFLARHCTSFSHVFLVLGNNEFKHGGTHEEVLDTARAFEHNPAMRGKLNVLEHDRHDLEDSDGVRISILGATMWSEVPPRKINQQRYESIAGNSTAAHNQRFEMSIQWLKAEVQKIRREEGGKERKILVITHHAPTLKGSSRPDQGRRCLCVSVC